MCVSVYMNIYIERDELCLAADYVSMKSVFAVKLLFDLQNHISQQKIVHRISS